MARTLDELLKEAEQGGSSKVNTSGALPTLQDLLGETSAVKPQPKKEVSPSKFQVSLTPTPSDLSLTASESFDRPQSSSFVGQTTKKTSIVDEYFSKGLSYSGKALGYVMDKVSKIKNYYAEKNFENENTSRKMTAGFYEERNLPVPDRYKPYSTKEEY